MVPWRYSPCPAYFLATLVPNASSAGRTERILWRPYHYCLPTEIKQALKFGIARRWGAIAYVSIVGTPISVSLLWSQDVFGPLVSIFCFSSPQIPSMYHSLTLNVHPSTTIDVPSREAWDSLSCGPHDDDGLPVVGRTVSCDGLAVRV